MIERYQDIPPAPLDPIMQANATWPGFKDRNPDAINTTIGVMIDPETGYPWRPACVVKALELEAQIIANHGDYGYQAPAGSQDLIDSIKAVYDPGSHHAPATIYQALGGTGALQLTKLALLELVPEPAQGNRQLVLDRGWPNHQNIFGSDFDITSYQHADYKAGLYNHEASVAALVAAPDRATVLFQGYGYNDDGLDRSTQEWGEVLAIAAEKEMTVILDMAYVGLTHTYYSDFTPIWNAVKKDLLVFANLSMSKNMGLYNERVGALMVLNADKHLGDEQAARFDQKIKKIIRGTTSNPPRLAAQAAAAMLTYGGFHDELIDVRNRLDANRALLAETLPMFPVIGNGSGLFTKLLPEGYTDAQYAYLQGAGIHALKNSRLNIGGLRLDQVERVGQTILQALEV
jgi:aspartate/tyrosine/aromatic aminotransferase